MRPRTPGAASAVLDLWLDYVEAHPYSWKLLFATPAGAPEPLAEMMSMGMAGLVWRGWWREDSARPRRRASGRSS